MSSIQDIYALEERIYDVHAISTRSGKVSLKADARDNIKIGKTTEIYSFSTLVRPSDNHAQEPDNDMISDIVNS